MESELEWDKAQKIEISVDILTVAKKHLLFLSTVDKNRWLYEDSIIERAIYRYKTCWLPLLAKFCKSKDFTQGPLVVPLDCEWVWHCHRLNPVRYKSDCEKLYGGILDNENVLSSIQQDVSATETEKIWSELYPNEPYLLNHLSEVSVPMEDVSDAANYTTYDLLSGIKRQIPFSYQVSKQHMNYDLFLETAIARYKGFLYLIKSNWEKSVKCFCVPTYDIDLIWHSHQLNPVSYCKDLVKTLGKVLEHDDTDSDRSKGKKLDTGFSETTKQWEETFGSRYWRAGAMYRGSTPSPVTTIPYKSNSLKTKDVEITQHEKITSISKVVMSVEIMLEFVAVRNLPEGQKGSISVMFRKTQPDNIFNAKRRLNIMSEYGQKQVALFQCEPTGNLIFDLVAHSSSKLPIPKAVKTIGSTSISLEELVSSPSTLYFEKWLELEPSSGIITQKSKPFGLLVALSFTPPTSEPYSFNMVRSRSFTNSSCFFPLPKRVQFTKSWTHIVDECGGEIISLQMRDKKETKGSNNFNMSKEVVGITKSGETQHLAEFNGSEWSLLDYKWSFQLQKGSRAHGDLIDLKGHRMIKWFTGRRLEYQPKTCTNKRSEQEFITVVEFSAADPYGKAVALFDLKCGSCKVNEEWFVLPGLVLAFILANIWKKEGYNNDDNNNINSLVNCEEKLADAEPLIKEEGKLTELAPTAPQTEETELKAEISIVGTENCGGCGGCGAGCGGCGTGVKSGSCGGCGGGCGGCGTGVKSGGCGGCGGGCGGCGGACGVNMEKGGKCSGCGGGCGGCGGCGGGVRGGGGKVAAVN
ncbi:glycine-rich domain-containing protein 1-like [Impatiens glandulifera]|uniref:glycine-rich domain-containing protein 1-like n=1 Tax=Impatiens glandulifera TaxID=253017 RepID=UPI001FB0BDD2|nr:glycine-rich domain-containing protein 1-like [Impatiens glandulifera]